VSNQLPSKPYAALVLAPIASKENRVFDTRQTMAAKQNMAGKHNVGSKRDQPDDVARLRALAHDLSNSLEAILQAAYLLGQGKLEGDSKRWAQLIDSSSQDAARINREMRKLLRALSGEES
jgi:signal transduction histidine kinase